MTASHVVVWLLKENTKLPGTLVFFFLNQRSQSVMAMKVGPDDSPPPSPKL